MERQDDSLLSAISTMSELEDFGLKLAHALPAIERYANYGEDITPQLKDLKIETPEVLGEGDLIWVDEANEYGAGQSAKTLSFVRPGNPEALGIRIGCVRKKGKKWRYCLECGFFTCRVVIVLDPIVVETPIP